MLPDMGAHRLSAAIAARSRNQGHSNDGTQPELSSSACVCVGADESGDSEARVLRHHFARWGLPCQHLPCSQATFRKAPPTGNRNAKVKEVGRVEASEISRELLRVLTIFASTHAHTHTYGEVRVRGMGGRSRYLCGDRGQRGYRWMNHAEILRFVRHEAMSR